MESKTVYFDEAGAVNTGETLLIAKKRAEELGIKTVLVASTRGDTAVKAAEVLQGLRVIAVSHSTGFKEPNVQFFSEENRKKFESKGGIVLTGTHLFAGLSRALRNKHNMYVMGEVYADILRIFGQGIKVACEIVPMAVDAGLIRTDEDVIVVAGRGRGADTAAVISPVDSQHFFDLRVQEILCKPYFKRGRHASHAAFLQQPPQRHP